MMGLNEIQIVSAAEMKLAIHLERTRLLAFVRAELERWKSKRQRAVRLAEDDEAVIDTTLNAAISFEYAVTACETIIAWLEGENG